VRRQPGKAQTPLAAHLVKLVIDHHTSRRLAVWRASNYALWIETYGETVADAVNKACTAYWHEKKLHGVPFHPVLVSLFRTDVGEKNE
jgi:hypothetical protein